MKYLYFFTLILSLKAHSTELIESSFDLRDLKESEECDITPAGKIPELKAIEGLLRNQKFWTEVTNTPEAKEDEKLVFIFPKVDPEFEKKDKEAKGPTSVMGMSQKQALLMSQDGISEAACSPLHQQNDMANRWCHSQLSQNFSDYLKDKGVNGTAADVLGAVMWAPKEYFYDLNPSASDLVVNFKGYSDEKTTVHVTVFGDALFKKTPGKDFSPMQKSSPFVVLRRKF